MSNYAVGGRTTTPTQGATVSGALFLAFGAACVNLKFLVENDIKAYLALISPDQWYPMEQYQRILTVVTSKYSDPAPILEQVGVEMMTAWYNLGPGKDIIERGIDFLTFQTSSQGYYSVIRGTPEQLGEFSLMELNEAAGLAVVKSTTPFSKDLERGVLRGGLMAPQDLVYVDVNNSQDEHVYVIEFH